MEPSEPSQNVPPILIDPPVLPRDASTGNARGASHIPGKGQYQSLNDAVIPLWRVHRAIQSTILLGIVSIPTIILSFKYESNRIWIFSAYAVVALVQVVLWFWQPAASFRNWRYRLDDRILELQYGIFIKTIQYLPLSRLQHVDLQSGPIERKLGLASVICYTAGTHSAVLVLPGLSQDTADTLRDYLLTVGGDDGV